MDGSRGSPVGTGLGGFGTVGSGSVGTGQGLVGNGQGLVGTGSGMVITGIGMVGTDIGTGSGDAGGSVGTGMGGQFPSGSQTLAGAIDPNILLAQQHSFRRLRWKSFCETSCLLQVKSWSMVPSNGISICPCRNNK